MAPRAGASAGCDLMVVKFGAGKPILILHDDPRNSRMAGMEREIKLVAPRSGKGFGHVSSDPSRGLVAGHASLAVPEAAKRNGRGLQFGSDYEADKRVMRRGPTRSQACATSISLFSSTSQ